MISDTTPRRDDFVVALQRRPARTAARQRVHERRQRLINTALAIGVPVVLLSLWEISARTGLIDHRTFPAPTTALAEMVDLARDGELQKHIWATLRRILIGYPIGAIVGLLVGIMMGTNARIRAALEPTLNGLYVVPKITLLPVFLSILGFGESPMVALIAVTVFFFVWIGTMEAVVTIPGGFLESAQALQLGRWATLRHVTLPAALPNLFVSLRVGMTIAILVIVAAEFVIGDSGLGYLIFHSRELFIYGWMYAGILLVAVLGVILAAVISVAGRLATPWMASDRARLRGIGA